MTEEAEPRYAHDCEACVFVGRVCEYDVYRCPQGGHPTIVARYGDEGEKYMSSHDLWLSLDDDIEVTLTYKGG